MLQKKDTDTEFSPLTNNNVSEHYDLYNSVICSFKRREIVCSTILSSGGSVIQIGSSVLFAGECEKPYTITDIAI